MINIKADSHWQLLTLLGNMMNITHQLINKRRNSGIQRLFLKSKPLNPPIAINKLDLPGIGKEQMHKFLQLIIKLGPNREDLHIFMSIVLFPLKDSILWFGTFGTTQFYVVFGWRWIFEVLGLLAEAVDETRAVGWGWLAH